jgi:integrating conjugative element protein (TIGR03746 family)
LSFQNELENKNQTIRYGARIIIGLLLIIVTQLILFANKMNDITVHYPPDIRSAVSMKAGEIPPHEVFNFALTILQQLNNWENNGAEDYPNNVERYRFYLTPKYRQKLRDDIELLSHGELRQRVRTFSPVQGESYDEEDVEILGDDAWVVWLDVHIEETVIGETVKDLKLRYPIRVVRYDTNRQMNPWQMALDGNKGLNAKPLKS